MSNANDRNAVSNSLVIDGMANVWKAPYFQPKTLNFIRAHTWHISQMLHSGTHTSQVFPCCQSDKLPQQNF